MKHAFLILAHTDFPMLQRLLGQLDDCRNDVYVHIDAKVREIPELHLQNAGLTVLENRVNVHWGDLSVVEAEYALFEEATKNGPYAYYHLLSGADLCLKTQDEIHSFFDSQQGCEFIGYTLTSMNPEIERKVMRWHLFPEDFRNESVVKRALRAAFLRVQELAGWRRNRGIEFKKGSQWVSVTEDMAKLFLGRRQWVEKVFSHSFCSDEMVMQTLCWNSPLRSRLYCTDDDAKGCVRAISWKNGEMLCWREEDIPLLSGGYAMFARKFVSGK